jgi:hypothetical protein
VIRGERAKQILNDPLVKAAFKEILDVTVMKWGDESTSEDGAKKLRDFYRATLLFKRVFEHHIDTGKMAEMQLKQSLGQKIRGLI